MSDCILWKGSINLNGYGEIHISPKVGSWLGIRSGTHGAHRIVWILLKGPIRPGLHIDHLCHNRDLSCPGGFCIHRRCVNVSHLEPVTFRENLRRGRPSSSALNRLKTHCPKGHEYAPENTMSSGGRRLCRTCKSDPVYLARKILVERLRLYSRRQRRKTHCSHGHEYTPENTLWRNAHRTRVCKECRRIQIGSKQRRFKDRCPADHPWEAATTYVNTKGRKVCRICKNQRTAIAYRAKHPVN